jgi:hypothetical protein
LVDDLSFGPATGVNDLPNGMPKAFRLEQNYPNPFNPTTVVRYTVSVVALSLSKGGSGQASRQEAGAQAVVSLKIYDLLGREVATLVNGEVSPGIHSVTWNASNVRSGVYFYRLTAGTFVQTKKLLLVR